MSPSVTDGNLLWTKYRGAVVPYITAWSGEPAFEPKVVVRPRSGIGYLDETPEDRDHHGVLWRRVTSNPGQGRPEFGDIHTPRQRHAMRNLLCQVCAGPADHNADGTLWLLKDHRDDWPGWPNGMAVTEPPVCLSCAQLSRRTCPALRRGHVAVRVTHCPVAGVSGTGYQPGSLYPTAITIGHNIIVSLDDPAIRWTCAVHLVREIAGCTIIELDAGSVGEMGGYQGQWSIR